MKPVISKEYIYVKQNFTNQKELFAFLANQLVASKRAENEQSIIDSFYAREEEFSTYVDRGIAIPHCRSQSIHDASVAIVINKNKIQWTEEDECPNLFFALMIPESNENQIHIRVLAQVAQLLMEDEFVEAIRNAKNEEEIFSLVSKLNTEI